MDSLDNYNLINVKFQLIVSFLKQYNGPEKIKYIQIITNNQKNLISQKN